MAKATSSAKLCSVCKEKETRYHCPVDRAGYCSVPCFKQHKAESCSVTKAPPAATAAIVATPSTIPAKRKAEDTLDASNKEEQPMRSLASLSWPPDPLEEGLNALRDPLNRDEPKPLLHSELMAIATSIPLRQLLSTHPFLKDLLTNLSRIPNAPPKYPQNNRVRHILGLGESEGVPNKLIYRPGEEVQDSRFGPGAGHRGAGYVDPIEREALRKFGELVKEILAEERSKRDNLQG